MRMNRRLFLVGAAALAGCVDGNGPSVRLAHEKRMAITLDDFNQTFEIGLTLKQRHENILEALEAVDHKAAGFVTGRAVNSPWGKQVIQRWKQDGHLIENHSWSHGHANESSSDNYLVDISDNRHFLSEEGFERQYFRFPFLDDGKNRGQQEALFTGLEELGLKNAPVTIDTVDWFTNSRLKAALRKNPDADVSAYRDYYVSLCVTLANHWDQVAQALGYKSLPHLTLMHHNVLNGLFLKDVLLALQEDGWSFLDAKDALAYPDYHLLPPEPTHGRNWLTLKAIEAQADIPPYPEEYYGFGRKYMDALGL